MSEAIKLGHAALGKLRRPKSIGGRPDGRQGLEFIRAVFTEVQGEHNQHHRPFQLKNSEDLRESFARATGDGSTITQSTVAPVAAQMLGMSEQSHGVVKIPNGWDTKRFSYVIEVRTTTGMITKRETMQGFTDYAEYSRRTGKIDPNTMLRINSHSTVMEPRSSTHPNAPVRYGQSRKTVVLQPVDIESAGETHSAVTTLRPVDALTKADTIQEYISDTTRDYRVGIHGPYTASRQENNSSASYVTRLFGAYKEASAANSHGLDPIDSIAAASHSSRIQEETSSDSRLIRHLMDTTEFGRTGVLNLGDMLKAFPEMAESRDFNIFTLPDKLPSSVRDEYDHLGGVNLETSVVHLANNALLSVMGLMAVGTYSFSMHNYTHDGTVEFGFMGGQETYQTVNPNSKMSYIQDNLMGTLPAQILSYGVDDFEVTIKANAMGSSIVTVSLNGGEPYTLSVANYTDALTTPTLAASAHELATMAVKCRDILGDVIKPSDMDTPAYFDNDPDDNLFL